MLQIFLLILKIILWIILAVLGLVVLVLALVLFAPVSYNVDASIYGSANVTARVRFLIVSLKLVYDQKAGSLDSILRIAGIPLNKKKGSEAGGKNVSEKQDFVDSDSDDGYDDFDDSYQEEKQDTQDELIGKNLSHDDPEKKMTDEPTDETSSDDVMDNSFMRKSTDEAVDEPSQDNENDHAENVSRNKNKPNEEADLRDNKQKLNQKLNNLKKQTNRFKKFWNLSCTAKTRSYLKGYLISLIKHIGPRKIKGHVRYGFGEPCKTGQYTGYLSLMPFVYQKNLSLEPDFYNKVLEGNVTMKGHLQLGYILRVALNINIWRTVKVARKLMAK